MALMGAINENGRLQDLQMIDGALKVASNTNSSTPEVIATEQDLTASYAVIGDAQNMEGYSTLGIHINADVNASTAVNLKVMGMLDADDTPFDVDAYSEIVLWGTTVADFEAYYEFEAGVLPYLQIEVKAGTVGNVAAYMTGGTGAQATYTTWEAITNASFQIGIDGITYNIDGVDFSDVTDMDDVAEVIQTAMRTASSTLVTCVWSSDHFVITSAISSDESAITVTNTYSRTDISGAGAVTFMDAETGEGTATAVDEGVTPAYLTGGTSATAVVATWVAITNGAFGIDIDGVSYEIGDLDFSACESMDDVAEVIQIAIRTATSLEETCVWDTDHFVITSTDLTASSEVSVTSTLTETDISGEGTAWMDSEDGVGTATAVVNAGDLTITVVKG